MGALRIDRVTQGGAAGLVALAPDGRYIAYVQGGVGQQSLWVRQVATRSDIQLLPPDSVSYVGVSFSPDGNYVYFVRSDRTTFYMRALYSVPTLGGTSRKLIEDVDAAPAFSPDGKRLAFVRGDPPKGLVSLITANADGSGEKVLWTVAAETARHNAPDWSPDGRAIAVATTERTANAGVLTVVNVANGTARSIYKHTGRMGRARWRPDGSALLVPLDDWIGERSQLWMVAYPGGEARRFTNDLSDYALTELDVTKDGRTLATVEELANWEIDVVDWPDGTRRQVTTGGKVRSMAWGADGSIYYTITPHVFRIDPSGVTRQLTPEGTINANVTACGDGTLLVARLEGDQSSIWRMDSDGANARGILSNLVLSGVGCSPDGKWVVYGRSLANQTVAVRAAIDGSASRELFRSVAGSQPLSISPDGTRISSAFWDTSDMVVKTRIDPAEGNGPLAVLKLPAAARGISWAPDGKNLHYALTRDGVTNIWEQSPNGGAPRQVTHFADRLFAAFAWSKDGRRLALLRGETRTDVVVLTQFVHDPNN